MIGKFLGKITDYTISEASNGNPQVAITFGFEAEGKAVEKTWFGSFVGGAKDITLKTLIFCGLQPQGFNALQNLAQGPSSMMLDMNKELELDIAEEPSLKDPSKMVSKINWVNDPANAYKPKTIDPAKNMQFFQSMQFGGDLMRLAGEMGLPLNNGQNATMGAPQGYQAPAPQAAPQPQQYQAPAPQQMPQQQAAPQNYAPPAQQAAPAPQQQQGFAAGPAPF